MCCFDIWANNFTPLNSIIDTLCNTFSIKNCIIHSYINKSFINVLINAIITAIINAIITTIITDIITTIIYCTPHSHHSHYNRFFRTNSHYYHAAGSL